MSKFPLTNGADDLCLAPPTSTESCISNCFPGLNLKATIFIFIAYGLEIGVVEKSRE